MSRQAMRNYVFNFNCIYSSDFKSMILVAISKRKKKDHMKSLLSHYSCQ